MSVLEQITQMKNQGVPDDDIVKQLQEQGISPKAINDALNQAEIKKAVSNVKGWAGNWDAVYDNILLRGKIKQEIVDVAEKTGDASLLEAGFNVLSNNAFHRISDEIRQEIGLPLSERVFPAWQKWLNEEVKKRKI